MSATASTPPPVHDAPAPAGRPPGTARVRVVMLLTFLAVSLLGTLVVLFVENNRLQGKHKQAGDITARFAYTIHDHLNRSLSATYALATLIRQGHGRIDHFEQLGNEMLSLYGGIDSLQLVPDGIIRQIAPLRGNERALGLNLFADTVRGDEALLAVKTRRLSLAGPAELIQGGQAVVGRLPVFLNRADGSEYLWGLVAVVIRIPDLLDAARLEQGVESGYDYELSRIRPDTGRPEVFARSSGTPLRSPVRYTIDVPNGSWILGLQPRAGWRSWPAIVGESVLVLFIGALVASMLGTLYKQPLVLQRMVDERTGQLSEANQKLTYEIRERERAEEALRTSEEFYRTLVDNLPLGIALIDQTHRIVMVNRTQSIWFGRSQESFIGQPCHEQFERREYICPHCPGTVSMQTGGVGQVDTEGVREDGSRFAVRLRTVPLFDGKGVATGFIEVAEDVTECKRVEEGLRHSEARLKESQRVAHIGHYEFDITTGFWTSSEELDAIFGIDDDYPRDPQGWLGLVHPDQRDEMSTYLARHVVGEGQAFNKEYRIERVNDRSVRWVHGLGHLEFGSDGRLLKMFGTIQDITERKLIEADRHKLEAQVLHAQKLESLGVLAGGIAHDFNNILMTILGHAELAILRLNPASPARDNLVSIEQSAQRAADLSRQMLAYSGKGKFVVETVDLGDLVTEMTHMLEVSISKKALLRFNLAMNLPPVEVDATQVRQVLMNLVINASEAIGDNNGVIAITTGVMRCERGYLSDISLDEPLPEGLYVFVEVADTGCGMDRDTLARIFDPFFTTKFTGRGLGMAAVLGIVRGHRGAIKVYSEPGKGTTFKVLLPTAPGHAERVRSAAAPEAPWRGNGMILLVDDEETIRALGGEMLEMLGFSVLTAGNGHEALDVYRTHGTEIAAVILDLTMPRMDGEETFRELRRISPDVRVIMSSGYNEQEVSQRFIGKGLAGFIQKPYNLAALGAALRQALGMQDVTN